MLKVWCSVCGSELWWCVSGGGGVKTGKYKTIVCKREKVHRKLGWKIYETSMPKENKVGQGLVNNHYCKSGMKTLHEDV